MGRAGADRTGMAEHRRVPARPDRPSLRGAGAEHRATVVYRFVIVCNFLPQSADGQRRELVRRLAAHDSALDIMAMDVVWAPEFAEAGWVLEWTEANKEQASQGVIPVTLQTRKAVRGAVEQQHPAAVVPQGPGPW